MGFETPFIEPKDCNFTQLLFLTFIYGNIVLTASNMISDGSEYLMLIPALAGIVGSIVLPILGAVPDSMMSLCSGLGPRDEAQKNVGAGIGVMAGSTVMLLTFPWFIAVFYGKVSMKDGRPMYDKKGEAPSGSLGFLQGGVSFDSSIASNAKIMLLTTLVFFVIQIPATKMEQANMSLEDMQENCKMPALIGMCVSFAMFIGYLVFCFLDANDDKVLATVIQGIQKGQITLRHAMGFIVKNTKTEGISNSEKLLDSDKIRLKKVLRPFFKKYDRDSSSTLNKEEFKCLLEDLNSAIDPTTVGRLFNETDIDKSGSISFDEFSQCLYTWMTTSVFQESMARSTTIVPSYDIDGEEDEEMDEDLANLDPAEQKKRILLKAFRLMLAGTALVLIFSDPLVDNLTEIGNRLSIAPFYVAFVIAPFASNASELISAKNYAAKKTQKSMTTSLGTLVGAACMNNTFGMGVVFGLMYVQGLAWKFTAETIAIVLSQWIIGALAIAKSVHTPMTAIVILAMYPGCLLLVSLLYKIGLD